MMSNNERKMMFPSNKITRFIIVLVGFLIFLNGAVVLGAESSDDQVESDKILAEKYELFLKWEKAKKYKKYKKYKKKYGFSSSKERRRYKQAYRNYKKYKKNPGRYPQYKKLKSQYKRYKKYRKYVRPYRKYKKYKKYNKRKYTKDKNKNYGGEKYRQAWIREKNKKKKTPIDLGGGDLGPEIKIGLYRFSKKNLKKKSFEVRANKEFQLKNMAGKVLKVYPKGTIARVKYLSDGKLSVIDSDKNIIINREVILESTIKDDQDIIFEILSPKITCYSKNCNFYRNKLKLRYSPYSKKIWLINVLPLEQYVWGMGEITGTGPDSYNDTMTIAYRTYGYWKIKYSTKFIGEGFQVNATPGNQLYFGYVWEKNHPGIKEAGKRTRGKITMYKDRIAIIPYSSWTDGRTRSWREKWGSKRFPWCQSVPDPYGKHPSKKTKQLIAEGNHMVGLSAHGALYLAKKKKWNYEKILKYYLKGIKLKEAY